MLALALAALVAIPDFSPAVVESVAPALGANDAEYGAPDVSVGLGLSWPEIALVYASVWPAYDWSIDGMFTLSTVDAGATYHLPISGKHRLLFQGLVGWTHSVVDSAYFNYRGVRFFGGVGYGAQASFDFRAVLGFSAEQVGPGAWGYVPTAFLMLGKVF